MAPARAPTLRFRCLFMKPQYTTSACFSCRPRSAVPLSNSFLPAQSERYAARSKTCDPVRAIHSLGAPKRWSPPWFPDSPHSGCNTRPSTQENLSLDSQAFRNKAVPYRAGQRSTASQSPLPFAYCPVHSRSVRPTTKLLPTPQSASSKHFPHYLFNCVQSLPTTSRIVPQRVSRGSIGRIIFTGVRPTLLFVIQPARGDCTPAM